MNGRRMLGLILTTSTVLTATPSAALYEGSPAPYAFEFMYWYHPGSGMGVDPAGNVWVADDLAGGFFIWSAYLAGPTQWAGRGSSVGPLLSPKDIAFVSSGAFFVLEANRVERFGPTRNRLGTFGSSGTGPAQFQSPTGIATDLLGNVYVSDGPTARVQKFSPEGVFLRQWVLPPGPLSSSAGGVHVDAAGRVFITDAANGRVAIYSPSGPLIRSWGVRGTVPGELLQPAGIAVDAVGMIYVADLGNLRVQVHSMDGTPIAWWRPTSTQAPVDVCTGPFGWVYVTGHTVGTTGWVAAYRDYATPATRTSWGAIKHLYQ